MNNILSFNQANIRWYKNGKLEPLKINNNKNIQKDLVCIEYNKCYYLLQDAKNIKKQGEYYKIDNFTLFDSRHFTLELTITIPITVSQFLPVRLFNDKSFETVSIIDLPSEIKDRIVNLKELIVY